MLPSAAALALQLEAAADHPGADLAPAALLIATIEYPRLEPQRYLDALEGMGTLALDRVARAAGADGPLHARVDAINGFLYGEQGFRGNRDHYADVRNSCLNQVLDLRTGIPITLAVVYMEVARRAGLRVDGINFPGHFLIRVRHAPEDDAGSDGLIVDPYHNGSILADQDCRELLARHAEEEVEYHPDLLARASKREILVRMLVNLKRLYVKNRSFPHARLVTHALLELSPSSLQELRDRGLLSYHLQDYAGALRDLEQYLKLLALTDRSEDGRDETTQIWDHVKSLRRRVASFN
jgi:regulator of sirC expression with transglutaminase-like and TPR domain